MSFSPSGSEAAASPSGRDRERRFSKYGKRGKLRNGTFIVPNTGERVRRQITLRGPSMFDGSARSFAPDEDLGPRITEEETGRFRRAWTSCVESSKAFANWIKTPTGKGILKCSLAYTLGSLATFSPLLANFLGHQDGKHMVATITVYFHPARSSGSMIEAAILGISAFLYAVFISVSSMAVSVYCETQLGLIELGHALILIVFCGGGLGLIGWFKQRYNAPLVSVACSLASLAIITVLTKENAVQIGVFEDDKIVQVMKMVIMGIISTSIGIDDSKFCLMASITNKVKAWPISARAELRESMIKTTDSFGDMLTMITRGFLSGSEVDLRSSSFNEAQSRYKSVSTQLAKNLQEAKLEHYVLGTEKEYAIEAKLVNCMQTLAQSIGGLRSAALTQFTLLRENATMGGATPIGSHGFPNPNAFNQSRPVSGKSDRFAVLTAIEEASEEGSDPDTASEIPKFLTRQGTETSLSSIAMHTVRTPSEIFGRFIVHLGPSMKSLAYTLSQILEELPFEEGPNYRITINEHFTTSLTEAVKLYSNARAKALQELYKSKEMDKARPESIEADFEEVAASCGHFSFNLQDFATEMQNYLEILEELKQETERPKRRSWKWMLFWRNHRDQSKRDALNDDEQEGLISRELGGEMPKDITDIMTKRLGYRKVEVGTKIDETKAGKVRAKVMRMLRFLDRDDIRFAVKVGFGAALYALFAFIPETRPTYQHYRGEWGLLSYMLVCSMTIGASNTTGSARFIGTAIGAIIACFVWFICAGNPYALAFCGWLVSLPCFYIIIAKGQGPFGRFIMLTYNLSCLYAYSLSIKEGQDDDDEGGVRPIITDIAVHRVAAVLAGCLWGLIITRVVWPISARKKFKEGLSLLWLRMGLVWKRDPLSVVTEDGAFQAYLNLKEEAEFHRYIALLDKFRTSAQSEFEIRGPFPSAAYGRIMESTNKIMDAFHAMNVVIEKNAEASEGEALLLKFTEEERAQLEYPLLADNLPGTANARDRLLAKIFQYRKNTAASNRRSGEDTSMDEDADDALSEGLMITQAGLRRRSSLGLVKVKDEDYEILYAFILVTGQLSEEIEKVQREVEALFGVLDEGALELR
ncbi:ribosomal l19 protein [Rutstroemia sp. NJR-2017a BBW]|nr:ribosomal l19 protein [Rutstroemia sp. NJR-2017a BBW]